MKHQISLTRVFFFRYFNHTTLIYIAKLHNKEHTKFFYLHIQIHFIWLDNKINTLNNTLNSDESIHIYIDGLPTCPIRVTSIMLVLAA